MLLLFAPQQAPPNLTPEPDDASLPASTGGDPAAGWRLLLGAGINDWGGVSPVTRDWVNPEKPVGVSISCVGICLDVCVQRVYECVCARACVLVCVCMCCQRRHHQTMLP